uniref:60S ribosomal protein L37a-like n=1 Tax=Ursus maritimus TaxID=29073 RepID=A0A452U7R0_URSMA
MAKHSKKVRIIGKYGTRYGASLRKTMKKVEVSQHAKYTCSFCEALRPWASRFSSLALRCLICKGSGGGMTDNNSPSLRAS